MLSPSGRTCCRSWPVARNMPRLAGVSNRPAPRLVRRQSTPPVRAAPALRAGPSRPVRC
jgi:hypothetical protein